ncbi:MAG: hypothetical protein NW220_17030 [Leptolyngbyaceae cyanobacterium bins.349]|nr:hypothetical protein [Leptolyngbyaceae cyanobacterium bins.349]
MNLILLIAAILVAFLVFTWLVKVVKATIGTAIAIAVLILVLQLLFGIGPMQVWQQVNQVFQAIWQTVTGGR